MYPKSKTKSILLLSFVTFEIFNNYKLVSMTLEVVEIILKKLFTKYFMAFNIIYSKKNQILFLIVKSRSLL